MCSVSRTRAPRGTRVVGPNYGPTGYRRATLVPCVPCNVYYPFIRSRILLCIVLHAVSSHEFHDPLLTETHGPVCQRLNVSISMVNGIIQYASSRPQGLQHFCTHFILTPPQLQHQLATKVRKKNNANALSNCPPGAHHGIFRCTAA